ncbi:U6 snRNA-associated Sm-like protein LSm1, putative (LSM1) [Plasmodium ovale wallikeri]|uniref:U6 snRNA-associated Sm-like protein LSm1, putative (LSM1) n=1 Tax=Plasmodium ovale wallikeri TaxID=864142 RepID=A0A1A8YVX7_PLAOA|nr:U6 snRNA-associated Sm-like protein LSm1, putative (LSM1) [Plasmodium ovale wallikeri]SBT35782.1 U6 snRNA-associated Sm-like protein LSm1, putative (LSM1) [Plasmodium ovale wallikeri]
MYARTSLPHVEEAAEREKRANKKLISQKEASRVETQREETAHKEREEKTMAQPAMPLWLSSFEEDIDTYIFISSRDNKLYLGNIARGCSLPSCDLSTCTYSYLDPRFVNVYTHAPCEHPLGNLIIRGDNIAYFGSVDEEKYTKMFDYSQNISSENEINEVSDELSTTKKENETGEHIVLRYKPVSHILKFMEESTVDSSIFEN